MAEFVHLHNHSEYSLLDGIARVKDIAARCQELGFDAYALTDHGVMYGAMEFYLAMQSAGLKPIIGCEMYIAGRKLTDRDPNLDRRAWHLVLLATDLTGYRNLMHLCSIAATDGFYYKPRVDVPTVLQYNEGLIALTACPGGVVAGPYNRESEPAAREALERYLRIFGEERLFLEVQNHGLEIEHNYRQWAQDSAREYGLRLVATNDCHYVHSEDARPHDIVLCLRDKKLLTDTDRLKYSGPEYYIKSEAEMAELFADCPEALSNTRVVADRCNLELDLKQVHFPRFTIHRDEVSALEQWVAAEPVRAGTEAEFGATADTKHLAELLAEGRQQEELPSDAESCAVFEAYLRKLTYEGAARRYGGVTPELSERIEYELSVIIPKGFTTYFLICGEFCNYARSIGIPVGPGRGSAAGSVVAYCLEITDLDPIKYGLYFERFLNPERIELPDFDIDFCYRRRDEVIEHVRQLYGEDRTAQIITYSRLKARAVIKAVGRTKGLEFQYTDRVTKEIHGLNPTISDAVKHSPALRQMIERDDEIRELINDAQRLEGIAAHHSVHAAGLVIAPSALWDYVPVQAQKDSDWLVTQYAMDTVPKTGLVKFDFLGLRNLTMIEDTAEYIKEYTGEQLDPRRIPDDDAETYAMLQRGDSYGVFQFEAPQVKRMLQEGRPETIQDLAAINAANRPGPLESGNTERYLQNRRHRVVGASKYKSISEILEPTGGVLLFQEQVLEIARKLGGFTYGQADVLRKAMGKKKLDVMAEQKVKFMAGVDERGIPRTEAEAIWDEMEKFAAYGFNKAHSACYSWVSYQTAYLKCHYPSFFMCAMLNSYMGHADKLAEILGQCRKMKIKILPPSINGGGFEFTPTKDGRIIFGLGGIKGIGRAAVEGIVAERRRGGEYRSTAGFVKRTRGKGVNKKVLQSLAMAGAFDCLDVDRIELIRNLDDIEQFLRGPSKQEELFKDFTDASDEASATPTREVTALDVALLEKEAVGVFLTHHPFEDHPMYDDTGHTQLTQLQESVEYSPSRWQGKSLPADGLVGLLAEVATRMSRGNKLYANARLEDPERSVRLVIWPKTYQDACDYIKDHTPVVVWGKVQFPEVIEEGEEVWNSLEIIVDRVAPYQATEVAGLDGAGQDDDGLPVPYVPDSGNGHEAQGNGHTEANGAGCAGDEEYLDGETDNFAPLPVKVKVNLAAATKRQMARFALALEQTSGEREVQMVLREVSGDIRRVKLSSRFAIDLASTTELEREFPFITFMDDPPEQPQLR